jgi:Flp pilus assembly protein TadG
MSFWRNRRSRRRFVCCPQECLARGAGVSIDRDAPRGAQLPGAARPSAIRRLLREEGGAAAVELALVAPMLAILAAGVIELSRLAITTMQVRAAAQAGADYAARRGWDPQGVAGAVSGATSIGAAAMPQPSLVSACASNGEIVATTASRCAAGDPPGRFVMVSATAPFASLFPGIGEIVLPRAVSAQATVRIP